jgi:hypothetical protein
MARVRNCAVQLEALELAVLDQSYRFGPILKEALATLSMKLGSVRQRAAVLEEVGPLRVQLLSRELEPMLVALEEGLRDLGRLVSAIASRPAGKSEEPESVYDELAGLERWFLVRLRHSAGEAVSEGYYRCCACGAFTRPGPGMVLGRCARCGGNCHHHVSDG